MTFQVIDGGGAPDPDDSQGDWHRHLTLNEDNEVKSCLANAIVYLTYHEHWRGVLALDTFAQRQVMLAPPPWHRLTDDTSLKPAGEFRAGQAWTDGDDARASAWLMQHTPVNLTPNAITPAVLVVSEQAAFHPIRNYFAGLRWDGQERISSWLTEYLGATPRPDAERGADYISAVGKWWLISAVARALDPGVKADHVLILEGAQGELKSTALEALAGEAWFTDEIGDLGTKDSYLALQGKWIVELSELDTMRRAETSRAKAFFSARKDWFRPVYGKRHMLQPRQCIFAGTVNPTTGYFTDVSGNRRYWPVTCGSIKLSELRRDRDLLWAEAVQAYRDGSHWWPERADRAMLEPEQDARLEFDAWHERIKTWILARGENPFTTGDLLDALGIEIGRWTRSDQTRVGIIVAQLGCRKFRAREAGARVWLFVGPTAQPTHSEVGRQVLLESIQEKE